MSHTPNKAGNSIAQKAAEIQAAGSASPGAGHPVVMEGGKAEAPTDGKGRAKPSASAADAGGAPDAGASTATAGKHEKQEAENAAMAKEQHGRGHRKAE